MERTKCNNIEHLSLLSAMFALSRVLYAIAADGLAFRFLAVINKRFKTPFIATWACGVLVGNCYYLRSFLN